MYEDLRKKTLLTSFLVRTDTCTFTKLAMRILYVTAVFYVLSLYLKSSKGFTFFKEMQVSLWISYKIYQLLQISKV